VAKKETINSNAESIASFLRFCTNSVKAYQSSNSEMDNQDKLTQDILHDLELGESKYEDRAKLATKLQQTRRLRRLEKNVVEELQPLFNWANSKDGKAALDSLRNILGEVRKQEDYHKNRCYIKKHKG